jgi:hypothetical protein
MNYLARLAAQAREAPPPQALRPAPSFLRPAGPPAPWAGELVLEVAAPAPVVRPPAGEPPQAQASGTRLTLPAIDGDAQTPRGGSAARRRDDPVIAGRTLGEPAPALITSATAESAAALAPVTRPGAAARERAREDRIAADSTPVQSAADRLAPPAAKVRLPSPTPAAAGTIAAVPEPVATGPPTITVNIDRIDVVSPRPAPSRAAVVPVSPPAPTLGLDDYLASRSRR